MSIQILPDDLVDQINAGEVIEDPVSVVKELVENSIDAKARNIFVEVHGGGLLSIVVHDDGIGMSQVDARKCILRHATSKLRKEEDLWKLSTLGFRGEALSSIAACSKMRLKTVTKNDPTGFCIEVDAGKIELEGPCALRQGTKIEVRSLFYNVPARLKFQKSTKSYVSQILKLLQSQALLCKNIGFVFQSQGKVLLDVKPLDMGANVDEEEKRIRKILGEKAFDPMIHLDFSAQQMQCHGVLADPSFAKKTRGNQYLFINHRLVISPLISRAVMEGYGTRLIENTFPAFILHVTVPTNRLDVNVHPQKKEVRLQDPSHWLLKIREHVDQALSKQNKPNFILDAEPLFSAPVRLSEVRWSAPLKSIEEPLSLFPEVEPKTTPQMKPLALIGYYLLVSEDPANLTSPVFILDLKAAYARCLFESFSKKDSRQTPQALLFPITLDISSRNIEKISGHEEFFRSIGIELHCISEKTVIIEALPSFLEGEDFSQFFEEILEDLTDTHFSHTVAKKEQRNWARTSVALAKKYKKIWSASEAKRLLQALFQCEDSQYDPLGNKILSPLKLENLETQLQSGGV